jgi:hypothetical protein
MGLDNRRKPQPYEIILSHGIVDFQPQSALTFLEATDYQAVSQVDTHAALLVPFGLPVQR